MEDKVVYRIISNIAVLENNDRVENIAVFKENLDDEKCNPNSPHFLVDNIPEDNLIAKISINLENGLLIPDNTKKDGRYTLWKIHFY